MKLNHTIQGGNMNELVLTLLLTSPMFLKADDPDGKPILRAAPFRGEMRYWLRAFCANPGINLLKQTEENAFGSTQAGSGVSLWVKPAASVLNHEQRYMLPHRLNHSGEPTGNNPLSSQAFCENQEIRLGVRGRVGLEIPREALVGLLFWLTFGGAGKRARRGFGSLQCVKAETSSARLPEGIPPLFVEGLPVDGAAVVSQTKKILNLLLCSVSSSSSLPTQSHFNMANYPSFQPHSWAVVVGSLPFSDYTSAMRDFWNNHLRSPMNIHPQAYGQANPRHASPLHVHIAQSQAGLHIILTAFFADNQSHSHKSKIKDLLEDCCTAYSGTAFFD